MIRWLILVAVAWSPLALLAAALAVTAVARLALPGPTRRGTRRRLLGIAVLLLLVAGCLAPAAVQITAECTYRGQPAHIRPDHAAGPVLPDQSRHRC